MAFYNGANPISEQATYNKLGEWKNKYNGRAKFFRNQIESEFKSLYKYITKYFGEGVEAETLINHIKAFENQYKEILTDGIVQMKKTTTEISGEINAIVGRNVASIKK